MLKANVKSIDVCKFATDMIVEHQFKNGEFMRLKDIQVPHLLHYCNDISGLNSQLVPWMNDGEVWKHFSERDKTGKRMQ